MEHYQEEGIGVKGFTSDLGSILKDFPKGAGQGVEEDSLGMLPRS